MTQYTTFLNPENRKMDRKISFSKSAADWAVLSFEIIFYYNTSEVAVAGINAIYWVNSAFSVMDRKNMERRLSKGIGNTV